MGFGARCYNFIAYQEPYERVRYEYHCAAHATTPMSFIECVG